jgi:hypothetical protein
VRLLLAPREFLPASICASKGIDIYRIATWLGDDVRVVQRHHAKLRPDDREIMKAFRA